MRAFRSNVGLLWPGLGLIGSGLISAGATGLLARRPVPWWWTALHGHDAAWHVFWAGIVVLCVAWLGLGWRLRARGWRRGAGAREVVVVAALWGLPLLVAPALFSLDMYSYLAQGALLAHGANPYRVAPIALARWSAARPVLHAVSHNWQHTTAPYGPLFLAGASAVAWVAGSHVTLGVTLMRLLELPGFVLLAVFVPRLAARAGADPVRASWLALASPLVLLYLVGGGHNDLLMIGLVVAGACLALEGRWTWGVVLCALAATVKLPGAAGVAVLAAAWLRAAPGQWRRVLASCAAVCAGVAMVAGLATGVGLSWLSGSLFSTPASAKNVLTPATDVAVTLWGVVHGGLQPGVQQAAASWETAATDISIALVALVCLWLLSRSRPENLVRALGLVLLAGVVGGPAVWPWYACWPLAVLACDPGAQRSPWPVAAAAAGPFAVMAGGQVAVPLPHAPRMLAVYVAAVLLAAGLWLVRRRREHFASALPHVGHQHPSLTPSELAR
jgi:alpha-1,6-mannosyltransferase